MQEVDERKPWVVEREFLCGVPVAFLHPAYVERCRQRNYEIAEIAGVPCLCKRKVQPRNPRQKESGDE